jgi:ABC-type nitrate/sulfonate/bicarbonate transport system permease component
MDLLNSKLGRYTLGVVAHLLLLLCWYLFVRLGEVPRFVMPSPADTLGDTASAVFCRPKTIHGWRPISVKIQPVELAM